MQKVLISWVIVASLSIAGCSVFDRIDMPRNVPFLYRIDIQQGNVVTQEMVDQLEPGMSKRQVLFVMGSPLNVDVFHQSRWDYVYTMTKGGDELDSQRVSLFFDGDQLYRVSGDLRPQPGDESLLATRETIVDIPDNPESKKRGLVTRALQRLGISAED